MSPEIDYITTNGEYDPRACLHVYFTLSNKWAFRWGCLTGKIPRYTDDELLALVSVRYLRWYYTWMKALMMYSREGEISVNHRFYSYINPECIAVDYPAGPTDDLRRLWEVMYVETLDDMPPLLGDKVLGFVAKWRLEIGK